jgi:hypothetical protein
MAARKKLRSDCKKMAKCGLTSFWKCRQQIAGLVECKSCSLVVRIYSRWKMVDRKPQKKCSRCGKFLPLDEYYMRHVKKDGKVYEYEMSECKMCVSEIRKEQYRKKKERWFLCLRKT